MSEEKSKDKSDPDSNRKSKTEDVNEHFPDDSNVPKGVRSHESGVGSQESGVGSAMSSIINQPETENMEVHHDHHHDPPGHKEKPWIHYLFEFLMLFLAVTLSFFVENMREEYVEHQLEKVYMRMLVNDLAADTIELKRIRQQRIKREDILDSLILFLGKTDLKVNDNARMIYNLVERSDNYESFFRNDRTIQQLKIAGGMRTLRKDTVAGEIMKYDNFIVSEIDWNNRTEATRIDNYKKERFQLLDAQLLNKLSLQKDSDKWHSLIKRKMIKDTAAGYSLMQAPPAVVNKITGDIFQVKSISITCRESGDTASLKATQLIRLIKKEYNLDSD